MAEEMTIGISKEDLKKDSITSLYWETNTCGELFNALIDQCKELNPWQPIETAPRDKRILVYNAVTGPYVSEYDELSGGFPLYGWFVTHRGPATHYPNATLWMDLNGIKPKQENTNDKA